MKNLDVKLPQWIWSSRREEDKEIELRKTFFLEAPVQNTEFHIALTGAVEVELDGVLVDVLEESAANVCAFRVMEKFPGNLQAGEHTLVLHIRCQTAMPVAPISIHLHDRLVGCIAYLNAENLWIPTDDTWMAGKERAVSVCLLGEEPYGDLEGGPEWFVAGGFGDIEASPLNNLNLLSSDYAEIFINSNMLTINGKGKGRIPVQDPVRNELHLFYHVRKQTEWREMNGILRQAELSEIPSYVLDLGKEYNMRFHIINRSDVPLTIVWNGAESLPELDNYEGLMTEVLQLKEGEQITSLPQGLRYLRMYILSDKDHPFELEMRVEKVGVPLIQAGTLHTDSVLLKQIFDISVHTNQICHQIGLWDGIKRDRLNWAYDFYLAAKADYVLWEDLSVLRRSIVELGRGTPEGYWMNAIPAYTLWWINNVWEYFLHTGDKNFVVSLKEEMVRHCKLIKGNIDPVTHELRNVTPTLIEWVPMEPEEGELNMQALLRMTGENVQKLKRYIPEMAALPDWGYPELEGSRFLSGKQLITKLLGIMAGYVDNQEAEGFLRSYDVQDPITPLSAYWLADCCSEFGLQEKAWEAVSKVWGKMLEEGATTCWESVTLQHESDFHDALTTYTAYDSYRISLCHSWAGMPVHWITSRVLGIQPLEPGYQSVSVRPQPMNGVTTCIGSIPTPLGTIEAGWESTEPGEYILRLPEGMKLSVNSG
ncbi:alpha-L-rhamnosidase C-terminal domain-containing protein [Paenibacillus dakarensis]|uniref:alpha-L-rhamnosidase C-terminal domain-containing protein n=1 Tax=Paenibacillus dakarensis TaxID=1527293 RepID=UPI0006D59A4C|nr:alpha-L-rhamnosidase C-terminal domain-containing protein [Paenibacillus dakarensis]